MGTIDAFVRDEAKATSLARRQRSDYVRKIVVAAVSALNLAERLAQRRRSRLDLLELTDHQLRDIGVSPQEARREGLRPFWD